MNDENSNTENKMTQGPSKATLDQHLSSYEFFNAVTKAIQAKVQRHHDQAVEEFQKSGQTPEEFNTRHYRDDGELFPSIENGEMKIMSVIRMPEGWGLRKKIDPEKVLKLYQENLSLAEIAASLKRTEKWVRLSLAKLGIKFGPRGVRIDPNDIPYGWKERDGKFILNDSEQWVLEKIDEDLRKELLPEQICKSLNGLKIKPRSGGKWIESMLSLVVAKNRRLKTALLK